MYCMIPLCELPGVVIFIETESQVVVTRSWGKGKQGVVI